MDLFKQLPTKVEDVTIGADPEVFLIDKDKNIVPACGLIGGNKEKPRIVVDGNLQEDNIMGEFGVDPSLTREGFVRRINSVFTQLQNATKYDLLVKASANIPKSVLDATPESKVFGCDPDFNAYTIIQNPTPDAESTLRTCAGHLHMGFVMSVPERERSHLGAYVVKYCDAVLGLWSLLVDPDVRRRTRYGKAGAYRPKPYGIEYRVPSNFWLNSDSLKAEVFDRMKLAYDMARNGVELPSADIERIINTSDTEAAVGVMGELSCLNV